VAIRIHISEENVKHICENPATTDQEPGGVFHSMIAHGKYLYVIETNRGFVLRVDPQTGVIERLYDMSIDNREHNPVVMTQRGNKFFVGTFGEDQGRAELAVFDKHFFRYTLPFNTRNPIVGLAWYCNDLYGVEIFPYDNQWSTDSANLVRFDRKTGKRTKALTGFASLPNGLVEGPDGALYTSNWGISFAPGDGGVSAMQREVAFCGGAPRATGRGDPCSGKDAESQSRNRAAGRERRGGQCRHTSGEAGGNIDTAQPAMQRGFSCTHTRQELEGSDEERDRRGDHVRERLKRNALDD